MRFLNSVLVAGMVLSFTTRVSADPSTTSRLGWVTNGDVRAAVQVGNTLYVGGTFTRVAPASGALGAFFGVSTTTALPLFPLVDGIVHAVEPDGAGGYFIGGAFTTVGGTSRTNLAHVLPGGIVDPGFAPTMEGGPVLALALGTSSLFVGGMFHSINGVARVGFALLDSATGSTIVLPSPAFARVVSARRILIAGANVITVSPGLPNIVPRAIASNQTTGAEVWSTTLAGTASDAVVAGSRLIVGGRQLQADRRTVVALDLTSGAIDGAWAPSGSPSATSPDGVSALAVTGTTLYVGGQFSTFGGQPRANAAAVDIPNGTVTPWAPNPNGVISALATTLTGNIVLSGAFTQVDGDARDTFAEVDLSGNVTVFTPDVQAARVQAIRIDAAGNVIAGGQAAVTDGSPRSNLAAFDLNANALLPWAPAMNDAVTALGAVGTRIFVGASQAVGGGTSTPRGVVSAVDGITGAPIAWSLPPSFDDVTLLGTHESHVYVGGVTGGDSVARVDATTALLDRGWRPQVAGRPTHMVISGTTMYLALQDTLASVDVATGAKSAWRPDLGMIFNSNINIRGLAVDGRTVYVSYRLWAFHTTVAYNLRAFDAITGRRTAPLTVTPAAGQPGALAVADGQLIVARTVPTDQSLASVGGVQALASTGQAASWNPGFVRADGDEPGTFRPALLVTPTDVVVLGYQGTVPVPVQGIAVLPRTRSPAPTSLNATTLDNQVTLAWTAPSTPPASYVVDVAPVSNSPSPTSLPTGSAATTVSGIAGNGTYFARVRAAGAPAGPASGPTNEIALVVGCSASPALPPLKLAAQVSGSNVTLSWAAPPFSSLSRYVLEAGSSPAATDIATLTFPASQTSVAGAVPSGTYFVRLRASNACGESAATGDVFFTVGSPAAIPPPPTGFSATANGPLVAIQWTASAGASGYVIEAGSAPGQSNLATLPLSVTYFIVNGVPPGVYYLRVRAASIAGLSAPSSEFILVVTP